MKREIVLMVVMMLVTLSVSAQNSIRNSTAPKAKIVVVEGGEEVPVEEFKFGEEHLLRVSLHGGVQNIDHKVYVTSTNAEVKHLGENEYMVKPVSEKGINLIVDVETFEDYYFFQLKPKGKKKKMKKVRTVFPPEKYMVSYETYAVQK